MARPGLLQQLSRTLLQNSQERVTPSVSDMIRQRSPQRPLAEQLREQSRPSLAEQIQKARQERLGLNVDFFA